MTLQTTEYFSHCSIPEVVDAHIDKNYAMSSPQTIKVIEIFDSRVHYRNH